MAHRVSAARLLRSACFRPLTGVSLAVFDDVLAQLSRPWDATQRRKAMPGRPWESGCLEDCPATINLSGALFDAAGYAGLEDEVDNHWGMLFKAALLSTLLSVGSEAGTGSNENSLVQALRQGASQSVNQTGQQIVGRYLNIQPTLTIRPGFPVRVIVNRDLVLEPYQG